MRPEGIQTVSDHFEKLEDARAASHEQDEDGQGKVTSA
jgi:hypothetical protein